MTLALGDHQLLIDDADYPTIASHKWLVLVDKRKNQLYVKTQIFGRWKSIHHLILPAPPGFVVDHINGNRLDNRRQNLRLCRQAENCRNQRKSSRPLTSKYKGVHRSKGKWVAQIGLAGRNYNLGRFK